MLQQISERPPRIASRRQGTHRVQSGVGLRCGFLEEKQPCLCYSYKLRIWMIRSRRRKGQVRSSPCAATIEPKTWAKSLLRARSRFAECANQGKSVGRIAWPSEGPDHYTAALWCKLSLVKILRSLFLVTVIARMGQAIVIFPLVARPGDRTIVPNSRLRLTQDCRETL